MFGQTFDVQDFGVIGLLVILEGMLSIDNALVLGLLAKKLPKNQQKKALTYGLAGAFIFRFIAVATAAYLLRWRIVKLLGGGYLAYVSLRHFFFDREKGEEHIAAAADGPVLIDGTSGQEVSGERAEEEITVRSAMPLPARRTAHAGFWSTVAVIEMTDIAFAIDSILAAIALVGSAPAGQEGPHPKLWVVITGGMLGVILMRYAAVVFIKLLERFPRFEVTAYLLVLVIGGKLLVDWGFNTAEHPHTVNFHSPANAAFWVFWALMAACTAVGFLPRKKAR